MSIDLIISYYKEDLDWLNDYKNINFRNIFIYNKGGQQIHNINRLFIEIKLDNIGKCDHTYLYHIIEKYDDLADVNIFTTGSVSLPHKTNQFNIIINQSIKTLNTVFLANNYCENVANDHYNFTLDNYSSSHINNKSIIEDNNLLLSNIRPFGLWYKKFFSNIIINRINYFGIFAVSKQHIIHHDINYYKNLINEFPDHPNPEVGHYFERSWLAIFYPIPENCILPNYESFSTDKPQIISYYFQNSLYLIIFLIAIIIYYMYKYL